MPVFFIEPDTIRSNQITITGPLCNHLVASLRIKTGEKLWFAKPGGPRYQAQVTQAAGDSLRASIISELPCPAAPGLQITLGIALVKNEHLEWAIQKATELGVSRLVPLVTRRSVVRPPVGRTSNRLTRWQTVAREAAQQSMRWEIPEVTQPVPFASWCAQHAHADVRLLLWENPQAAVLRDQLHGRPRPRSVVLAIGPEGGFEAEEVSTAKQQGFEVVSLGPRILRTESAALAALSILQYEWGDLG
jgi:16S rRNA (uracil1498-N3)-methyltransferase